MAGTLASILAIVADLFHWRMSDSGRPTRIMVAVVFFIMSVVVGIASLSKEPSPVPQTKDAQAPAIQVITQTFGEPPTPTPKTSPIPKPVAVSKPKPHSEITLGERERSMPEVIAAADDALMILRAQARTVRGDLRGRQSDADAALAGLITTDLTLDVKLIDDEGIIRDAFTVTSRGGGFTADESGLQARQRLRDALQKRMKEEQQ